MILYLVSSLAARIAIVMCVVVILLPYGLRRNRVSLGLGLAQERPRPYLYRLWPHFWLGYLILALSTVHAGTVMMVSSRANRAGILAASAAFFLLLFEIVLGLSLKDGEVSARKSLRRVHFWTMLAFVGALAVHLWLNG
jgi:hypothetical protein